MRDRPKATTMWAVGTITMPSIILAGYYLFGAPDDEREEYAEIPQWQKDLSWVFKAGGSWRRVPKPFALGYIFGSVPERFMQYLANDHPDDGVKLWKDVTLGTIGSLSPVYDPSALIPPLIKVTMENVSNYNYFKGRNIYPAWMDDLPASERYSKYTSETSKLIGEEFEEFDISPAKIDNALRGTLGGSSRYVLGAGDFIINEVRKWNEEDIPEKPTSLADMPLLSAFNIRDPMGSTATSLQAFWELNKLIKQTNNKYKRLPGEEKYQYREDNQALIESKKVFNTATKNISKFNKRRNRIENDLDMTAKEKEEEFEILDELILNQAKRANNYFDNRAADLKGVK